MDYNEKKQKKKKKWNKKQWTETRKTKKEKMPEANTPDTRTLSENEHKWRNGKAKTMRWVGAIDDDGEKK